MSVGNLGGSGGQDFDLNLAPIIDCLTVLIAFMLASAGFLSLGILDAGASAAGSQVQDTQAPPVQLAVEIQSSGYTLKLTGKSSQTSQAKTLEDLAKELAGLKARWPQLTTVTLSATDAVEYSQVIRAMEGVKKTFPAVVLGGF